jgi:MinD-like ATPase involved in chromosome partitioning or flagellar assembly/CheY-like chemotaxis protein
MEKQEIRLLLIEDNPGDAKLASIMLASAPGAKFQLETCDRLATGLDRLAKGGFHALLLDLSLPDSFGFETFERAHAAAPTMPIVLMSSLDDEQTAVRAVESGAQDYLIKGRVDSISLGRAVRFAVERQRKQIAPALRAKGKVLAFFGAKGGVGTSTVALNIASGMAWAKRSVIAVELRANFGTFSAQLGCAPARNLGGLLELAADRISEAEISSRLIALPSGLKVLFGPQTAKEFREIEPEKAEVLVDALAHMAEYVVIDLPDASAHASQIAARHCNFGALVLDNDPLSIACGKMVLDQLAAAGISRPLWKAVVVNRSAGLTGARLDEIGPQLGCGVFGVVTPAAELCLRAQKAGAPFILMEPESIAAGTVYEMVYKLVAPNKVKLTA